MQRGGRYGWVVIVVLGSAIVIAALVGPRLFHRERPAARAGSVTVVAAPGTSAQAAANAGTIPASSVPLRMQAAAGANARFAQVRVVDADGQIVCALVSRTGQPAPTRAVWIGKTETLVVDDGGVDFAILEGVCDPSRPGRR